MIGSERLFREIEQEGPLSTVEGVESGLPGIQEPAVPYVYRRSQIVMYQRFKTCDSSFLSLTPSLITVYPLIVYG